MADDELRNALAGPSEPPALLGPWLRDNLGSAHRQQFEWAKNNPQIASPLADLLKYLSFMPMGRSVQGARIGNDAVMASRLGNNQPMRSNIATGQLEPIDPGITGGRPIGTRGPIENANEAYNSSTGLVGQNREAFQHGPPLEFSAPRNRNNPAFGRAEYRGATPQDIFRQIENSNLPAGDRQYLLALARQRFGRPPDAAND